MSGETSPERPELRASHEDRDQAAERLRVAAGDGRLTLEELDERLERALTARTRGELEVLVTDLPAPPPAKELVRIEVRSASAKREGRWVVPRALDVSVASGTVTLDLTEAVISYPTLRITAEVRSGTLMIITRPGIEVADDDVRVSGGVVKIPSTADSATATILRVDISGSVRSGVITAGPPHPPRPPRPPRRSFLAWLLRRPRPRG